MSKSLINRYCRLRQDLDTLKTEEKILRTNVFNEMNKKKVNDLTGSNGYAVKRITSSVYLVNPLLLYRRIKLNDFLKCVKVSITGAKDFLPVAEVLKISHKSEKTLLKVNL